MQILLKLIDDGGIAMVAIFALSIVGWYVMLNKWFILRREYSRTARWRNEADELVKTGNLEGMRAVCLKWPCTASKIMRFCLRNDISQPNFIRHLDTHLSKQAANGRARLAFISVVAATLPLLGLLGTIFGMVTTFTVLSEVGTRPELLAGGISQALLTTEAGMLTALPIVLGHAWLKSKQDRALNEAAILARSFRRHLHGGG